MNGKRQVSKKLILAAAVGLVALVPMSAIAASNKLIVQGPDGTTPTNQFVVSDRGYIGIGMGTAIPSFGLQIVGPPGGPSRVVAQTTGVATHDGGGGFIGTHNNDSATNSSLPLATDRLGFLLFGSQVNGSNVTGAGLAVYAEGQWGPYSATSNYPIPTYFAFETAQNASPTKAIRYERLRVSSNGNIGINQTAPTQKLEVNGGVRLNVTTNTDGTAASTKPDCTGNSTTVGGTLWFTNGGAGTADTLEVCAKDAGGNYTWRALF